jgi:hypothetical protein
MAITGPQFWPLLPEKEAGQEFQLDIAGTILSERTYVKSADA